MKEIKHYLDEAIEKQIVKNDADTANKLGVSRACISDWRRGKNAPSDEQAIALAQLIGKPVIELMAESAAYRAKTPEAKSYWEQIAKYSATYASVAAIAVSSLVCVTHSPESQAQLQTSAKILFIM
jgi:transcriptional regulator with XRE-family HTH domain